MVRHMPADGASFLSPVIAQSHEGDLETGGPRLGLGVVRELPALRGKDLRAPSEVLLRRMSRRGAAPDQADGASENLRGAPLPGVRCGIQRVDRAAVLQSGLRQALRRSHSQRLPPSAQIHRRRRIRGPVRRLCAGWLDLPNLLRADAAGASRNERAARPGDGPHHPSGVSWSTYLCERQMRLPRVQREEGLELGV